MFLELIKGVALLLALCFLHGVNIRVWRNRPLIGQLVSGALFGAICVVGMLVPVVLVPGVIFDARSVVLSMAGLFGGPLVAGVAGAMTIAWRISMGGAGTSVVVLVVVICVASGLLYRYARQRGKLSVEPLTLAVFGMALHAAVLGAFQFMPSPVVQRINDTLALPFFLTFTIATVLLGMLLKDVEERLNTERALLDSSARLQAITHAIPDVLLVLDRKGRYLEVLSNDKNALVADATELLGKRLHDVLPPDQAQQFLRLIEETLRTGQTQTIEYEIHTLTGARPFEGRTQPLKVPVQGEDAVVFMARDMTARRQAEAALRESEQRFRSLLLNIPSISVQGYLADGTTSYWNKASETLYGYTAQEAMGSNLFDLIIPPVMHDTVRSNVEHMFATGEVIPAGELQLQRKDGSLVDVFSSHAYIHVAGQPPEMFCIDIDISGRKAAEEEARYLAFYDALTELPNRRLLVDRLQQVLASSARTGMASAVLFVDLDNFKTLNDTRGHEVGDMLLTEVAQRLQTHVRELDTVARLGGDEFVVLLENNPLSLDVTRIERKIHAALASALRLGDGRHLRISVSIGVAHYPDDGDTMQLLLRNADRAMYASKTGATDR